MTTIITYPKRPRGPSITCFADVKRIAPRMGLTEGTVSLLIERGYGSVQGLRDMTEADLEILPLYAGQQLAVSKLVTHLNEVLEGHEILDGEKILPESTDVNAKTMLDDLEEESEKEAGEKQNDPAITSHIDKVGILADDGYPTGVNAGSRKVPRPHEFLVGKTSGKALSRDEFLYGNLLILEYMIEQGSAEVRAHVKHLRFMVLKLIHGYPLEQIIYYDYALRDKIESERIFMPLEADSELLEKYVTLHMNSDHKHAKKTNTKKTKKHTKGKKKANALDL